VITWFKKEKHGGDVAAIPVAVAEALMPPSKAAIFASNAARVDCRYGIIETFIFPNLIE